MDTTFPIVLLLYRRPEYSRQVLEALAACDGISSHPLHVHIDRPSNPEHITGWYGTIEVARSFGPPGRTIEVSQNPRGCTGSVLHSLGKAFAGHRYVAYFEDDTVPAKDCLSYFKACEQLGVYDCVWTVCAYNRSDGNVPPGGTSLQHLFHPWGFATWADRWAKMDSFIRADAGKWSWDMAAAKGCEVAGGLHVYPLLSRTQNIGALGGTHVTDPIWHAVHQHTRFWAGANPPPVDWPQEIAGFAGRLNRGRIRIPMS